MLKARVTIFFFALISLTQSSQAICGESDERYFDQVEEPVEITEEDLHALKRFYESSTYKRNKRLVDALVSALVLPLALPVGVAVGSAIYLADGGPVIFVQERIGKDGKPFNIYKFRTMRQEAGPLTTHPQDPRVTRIGKILRHLKLDELPQIINVLRGEMSWVGPRPLSRAYIESVGTHNIDGYTVRVIVPPGLTGESQISDLQAPTTISECQRGFYDRRYVSTWSAKNDVKILLKTLGLILKRTRG